MHTFVESRGFSYSVSVSPDSLCVATAGSDHTVKVYDIRTRQILQLYALHQAAVNQVSFHPSGKFLLSGSQDGSARVYDLLEGRPLYTVRGHEDAVTAAAFCQGDGTHFATGSSDERVFVWSAKLDTDHPSSTDHEVSVKDLKLDGEEANRVASSDTQATELTISSDAVDQVVCSNNGHVISTKEKSASSDQYTQLLSMMSSLTEQVNGLSKTVALVEHRLRRLEQR